MSASGRSYRILSLTGAVCWDCLSLSCSIMSIYVRSPSSWMALSFDKSLSSMLSQFTLPLPLNLLEYRYVAFFFISSYLWFLSKKTQNSVFQYIKHKETYTQNIEISICLKIAQRCLITNIPIAVIIISITEIAVIKYAEINRIISNKLKTYQIVFEHNVQS